jgi:hypothetical protein
MKGNSNGNLNRELLTHTHDDVLKQFNEALFAWARTLSSDQFETEIKAIIDKFYIPATSLSTRFREKPVKDYLNMSKSETSDTRLAYILSSGNEETGALNKLLIQHLTPMMLQTFIVQHVHTAVRERTFNSSLDLYTRSAVAFAKDEARFIHLYSKAGVTLFYKTMYEWIDTVANSQFTGMIKASLTKYEGTLWFGSSRRPEIENYMKRFKTQSKIVAMVFLKGEDSSTCSFTLFNTIINTIKAHISTNEELCNNPGYKLIKQYNELEHKDFYHDALKAQAAGPSHKQEAKNTASSSKTPAAALI